MLDHIVLATNDISATSALILDATGVRASQGGPHVGRGTRNELCSLGEGRYLEIIGPDREQTTQDGPMPFGLDHLRDWGVATWCSRRVDLLQLIDQAAAVGLDISGPEPMQRQAPDGLLQWVLAVPTYDTEGGTLPFFIDWGSSPHPSSTVAPTLELVSFSADHPDPSGLQRRLESLGEELTVNLAEAPGLRVILAGPEGTVTLPIAGFE